MLEGVSCEKHLLPGFDVLLDDFNVLLDGDPLGLCFFRFVLEDAFILRLTKGCCPVWRGEGREVGELVPRGHEVDVEVVDVSFSERRKTFEDCLRRKKGNQKKERKRTIRKEWKLT